MIAEYDNLLNLTEVYWSDSGLLGWGVRAENTTLSIYPALEAEINGFPLVSLNLAFYNCTALVDVPQIPDTVTQMHATFYGCSSIISAPDLPNGVVFLDSTFKNCTALTYHFISNSS